MRVLLLLFLLIWACQGPKAPASQDAPAETTPTTSYVLSVEGMTCTGCENTVQNAVKSVEGVYAVQASFEDELVSISVTEKADTVAIREQIINSGYTPTGGFALIDQP